MAVGFDESVVVVVALAVPRWAIRSRLSPRAWSKSNSSNDLREPCSSDKALSAVGSPGGDLTLQTRYEKLFVGPGLRAGPLSQSGHRLAHRGRFERAGEEADFSAKVAVG